MTDRRRMVFFALPVLVLGVLMARHGWSQTGEESAEATSRADMPSDPTEFCVSPEEMAVIERVRRRHWELQQREEILVLQEQAVREVHAEIRREVRRLEQLRGAIEDLLQARQSARREGGDALVRMVDQMKPAEAADMLSLMDPLLAAAVIERLSPRQAGRILGSMDPVIAAKLGGSLAMDSIHPESQEGEQP